MRKQIFRILSDSNDNPASFTAEVVPLVQLDPAIDYELALLSISFVNSIYTIPHPLPLYYQLEDSEQFHRVEVPAGYYSSVIDLVDKINSLFVKNEFDESGFRQSPHESPAQLVALRLDSCSQRVHYQLEHGCEAIKFEANSQLAKILGAECQVYRQQFGCFERPAMNPNNDLLLIECDQVQAQCVGNHFTPTLQTVSLGGHDWGRRTEVNYKNKQFCPLAATHRLSHIAIRLRSIHNNEPVQLLFGPTLLTFELRESWTFDK